jgi:hypothetical protein
VVPAVTIARTPGDFLALTEEAVRELPNLSLHAGLDYPRQASAGDTRNLLGSRPGLRCEPLRER